MSYRVVVVDDRAEIVRLLRARFDFEDDIEIVGEASNGAEAVERCRALQPHAVVLDLEMPVMRGDTAIPLLREVAPGITVVLYTAAATIDLDADDGPDAIVDKSHHIDDLVVALRTALGRRATRPTG
jgi:DNA-binding NarL/FixJ family response regulator